MLNKIKSIIKKMIGKPEYKEPREMFSGPMGSADKKTEKKAEKFFPNLEKSTEEIMKLSHELIVSVDKKTEKKANKDFFDFEDSIPKIKVKKLRLDVDTREKFFKQYLRYRSILFYLLLILLIIESLAVFIIVILSAVKIYPCNSTLLKIDPGALKILVGATLAQICLMIIWIIRSVFPPDLVNIMGKTE